MEEIIDSRPWCFYYLVEISGVKYWSGAISFKTKQEAIEGLNCSWFSGTFATYPIVKGKIKNFLTDEEAWLGECNLLTKEITAYKDPIFY